MSKSEPKGEQTLNRASVTGSRRVIYGLLYALSLAGLLLGVALLGTAVKVGITSYSELSKGVTEHYWTNNWLIVGLVLLVGGLAVLVGSSVLMGKFKREEARNSQGHSAS